MNILEILKKQEGKTVEFKRDISSPNGILRTIVAFANTAGGILIIGVEDKSRTICGIKEPLLAEEKIANIIADSISPKIIPEIEIISWRDVYLLTLQIFPSASRPHHLKQAGEESSTFVRVGSTNRLADKGLIAELKRFIAGGTFDEQPYPNLTVENIDLTYVKKLFTKASISNLETMNVLVKYQGKKIPTIGGILLFSPLREKYFPDTWIQVGRFKGVNKTHIIDTMDIHSYLVTAIEEMMSFVQKHAMQTIAINDIRHTKKWNIPLIAIREAIINAIVHADYSQYGSPIRLAIFDDRIEIENPGLLQFGLTIDDIMNGVSKLRNRVIGRVFHKLGLIEQWGSGIKRIIDNCQEYGYAAPRFEEIGTHFRVTIFTQKNNEAKLDNMDNKIIQHMRNGNSGYSTKELAKLIGLSERATRTRLLRLMNLAIIIEVRSGSNDPQKKYYLTQQHEINI